MSSPQLYQDHRHPSRAAATKNNVYFPQSCQDHRHLKLLLLRTCTSAESCCELFRMVVLQYYNIDGLYCCTRHTGWFKHQTPSSFRCQCPRRFLELDPEILHTCLMCPCRALNECFFSVFFARYVGFCIFWDIWVLRNPTFSAKKAKNTKKHS